MYLHYMLQVLCENYKQQEKNNLLLENRHYSSYNCVMALINWQKRGLGKVIILRNSIAFSHAILLKLLIYLSLPCSFGRASQQKQFKLAKIFFLMQSAQLGKCNRNIGIMVGMLLLEYRMNFH